MFVDSGVKMIQGDTEYPLIFDVSCSSNLVRVLLQANGSTYGELLIAKISDNQLFMSRYMLKSYSNNVLVEPSLKGLGKQMLSLALRAIIQKHPQLQTLEGEVATISNIRTGEPEKLIELYKHMGGSEIRKSDTSTLMRGPISGVLEYCDN
jgi:hypothetical protein